MQERGFERPADSQKPVEIAESNRHAAWDQDSTWQRWLSSRIWNLNWSTYFPFNIPGNIPGETSGEASNLTVQLSSFDTVAHFLAPNFGRIYEEDLNATPFLCFETSEAKNRFYREAADFFAFKDGEKTIGVLVGNPLDWSTYYLRNVSILPEYQNRNIFQPFFGHLLSILADNSVERAEADIALSNLRQVHILNKLGFNITGMTNSERWGATARFTKFFSRKHETAFLDQFCLGMQHQLKRSLRSPSGTS
ncbi:MAG TPA: GNAT family N-acetyltransferase [Bdellovibrionota bacterium]|nr:GNAT family N-acetyltransferase [Bdellovibrionota bacterium]